MRVLPHHDDTGGFFIAVFEKMAEMPASCEQPKKLKGGAVQIECSFTLSSRKRLALDVSSEGVHSVESIIHEEQPIR
jgi:hypothetical protein